jgi:hypothetical protein
MTQNEMLFLDKMQRKSHFDASNTIKLTALIPVMLFFIFLAKEGSDNLGRLAIACSVMALILLLVSYLISRNQRNKLKLTTFKTDKLQLDNIALTKETLNSLEWPIVKSKLNFIEAYNPHKDIRTWGNEMISIVILDNKILLNSICNLNSMNQSGLSFGKNKQNVQKFIKTFELIAGND